MTILAMIAIAIVMMILTYLLTPKPKIEKLKPESEIDVPETEVGKPLPVIFGTVVLRNPNVVWFGHLRVKKIRKKV